MRRVLLLVLVLAAGGWTFLFSLANSSAVELDLVLLRLEPAALSVWVVGAFVAGGLCGLAASSVAIWRVRAAGRLRPRGSGESTSPAGAAGTDAARSGSAPAS